jgi:hypothetical protein
MADENESERLLRLERSGRRARWMFVALGVAAPLGLHALFERQARRLDALALHGRTASATATTLDEGGGGNLAYEYTVDGTRYAWSVKASAAPCQPGQTFTIRYLPEDPSLSRPGDDGANVAREAASNRSFAHKAELGVLGFFLFNLALTEAKIRKLRKRERLVFSPRAVGRVVALLFMGCALVADLSPEVRAIWLKAFGTTLLGLPVVPVVVVGNLLLLLPYFWVCEHLMRLVFQAAADRASLSKGGLISYILFGSQAHPGLARSRRIALGGFAYFVALTGTWIAYANHRGF